MVNKNRRRKRYCDTLAGMKDTRSGSEPGLGVEALQTKNKILDVLGVATVALAFVVEPSKWEKLHWWIGPLVIVAWGWSLWRRNSPWGKPVILFGLFLFRRAYLKDKQARSTASRTRRTS